MNSAVTARTGRLVGRVAAVLAVALLVGGLAVRGAGAEGRRDAVQDANDFINACYGEGGYAEVLVDDEDNMIVACYGIPGGYAEVCTFYDVEDFGPHAVRECWFTTPPLTRPPDITHGTGWAGHPTLASDDGSGAAVTNQGTGRGTVLTAQDAGAPATDHGDGGQNVVDIGAAPASAGPVEPSPDTTNGSHEATFQGDSVGPKPKDDAGGAQGTPVAAGG